MTIITNTMLASVATSKKESVADVIYNIDPTETPIINSIGRGNITNYIHQWHEDSYAAPSATPSLEGDQISYAAATQPTNLTNYTQIQARSALVSGSAQHMAFYGAGDILEYHLKKAAVALKKDIEKVCFGVSNAKVARDSTTAGEAASFNTYIKTNTSRGATGSDPTGDGTDAPGPGTDRDLLESYVHTVHQKAFDAGGNPTHLFCNPYLKTKISQDFTGGNMRVQDVTDKVNINSMVEIIHLPLGYVAVQAVRDGQIAADELYLIDPKKVKVQFLRPIHFRESTRGSADADGGTYFAEFTLEVSHRLAHGVVADLNDA